MNRFLDWLWGRQYQESSFRFARLQDHRSASSNPQPGTTLVARAQDQPARIEDKQQRLSTALLKINATVCVCGDPGGRPQAWERSHGAEAQ